LRHPVLKCFCLLSEFTEYLEGKQKTRENALSAGSTVVEIAIAPLVAEQVLNSQEQ